MFNTKKIFKHKLGIQVKCRVTELNGIITARSENLNMCKRYFVQPKANNNMTLPEGYWIDEDDLIKIGNGIHFKEKTTGCMLNKIK